MRLNICVAVFLVVCLVPGTCLAADPTLVPSGSVPQLDGTLAEGEWDDALRIPLSDQAYILLKHTGGFLYLGVQATTMGAGSPLLVRGDEVRALHVSAALGTAVYVRAGDAWGLAQDFVWQCRALGFSATAVAQRASFLQQEGWLGTIGYLGAPTQFEYQIAWGNGPLTLLFLFMEGTEPLQLLSWPLATETAAQYMKLLTGPIPQTIHCSFSDGSNVMRITQLPANVTAINPVWRP